MTAIKIKKELNRQERKREIDGEKKIFNVLSRFAFFIIIDIITMLIMFNFTRNKRNSF